MALNAENSSIPIPIAYDIAKEWINYISAHVAEDAPANFSLAAAQANKNECRLCEMCVNEPKRAWQVIRHLTDLIDGDALECLGLSNDEILRFLGAGPMEDLLNYNGMLMISDVISAASASKSITSALHFVDEIGFSVEVTQLLERFRSNT